MVAATAHDLYAAADYDPLAQYQTRTVREGIRWHLIERTPLNYDLACLLPLPDYCRCCGPPGEQASSLFGIFATMGGPTTWMCLARPSSVVSLLWPAR
jgi:hypothetical protein